ncbi:unnamed protein product [Discosporangium mesarthrocarpum]
MLFELNTTLRGTLAVTLLTGYPERLLALGETWKDRPASMDEANFPYANGFFYEFSQMALQRGFPDPCPMHTEYLEYGREKGLFKF